MNFNTNNIIIQKCNINYEGYYSRLHFWQNWFSESLWRALRWYGLLDFSGTWQQYWRQGWLWRGRWGRRFSSGSEPNQPDITLILTQSVGNRVLTFQQKWFELYPWLHYSPPLKGVLCFQCVRLCADQKSPSMGKSDPVFISAGFRNWKKALEKCALHEKSAVHSHAVAVNLQKQPVDAMLPTARALQQKENRHSF